jgi:uncharacterized protein (TIGR02453 family)
MIDKSTFDFLAKLKKNNSKEWFDANRKAYDQAKQNMIDCVSLVIQNLARFEPGVSTLEARKCLFRINRDIRFSKDKSPYKTNFGASINPGGKNAGGAGYYLHLEPGKSFLAGGAYMPDPAALQALRQEIDYNFKAFQSILQAPKFKKTFNGLQSVDKLVRTPKGYEDSNPAADILKHKHFIVSQELQDKDVLAKTFIKQTTASFATMQPFIRFLRVALD